MKSATLIALGVASVGLIAYTVHFLDSRPGPRDRKAAAEAAEAAQRDDGRGGARNNFGDDDETARKAKRDADRDALAIALRSRLERALDAPEEEPTLPTVDSRLEAETAFDVVMQSVEELADKGDRVSKHRRKRLYRAANDAFAALSDHLDPGNQRDMTQLEDAHTRLKLMLREIGAGPPGFKPAPPMAP